jgi:hypothetical protein
VSPSKYLGQELMPVYIHETQVIQRDCFAAELFPEQGVEVKGNIVGAGRESPADELSDELEMLQVLSALE